VKKRFKLLVALLIILTSGTRVLAQSEVRYKDVLLDGKPAKLNVATGEITFAISKVKSVENKVDSVKTKLIRVTNPEIITALSQPEVLNEDVSDFHVVKEGDNLFQLSLKYKTSLTELKKANNLETTLIRKGQKLRIRNFDTVRGITPVWIVKKGDNLYRISIETGTTVNAIKSLNGLTSDTIYIDQKLQLK
jgi:LysM repeat protein